MSCSVAAPEPTCDPLCRVSNSGRPIRNHEPAVSGNKAPCYVPAVKLLHLIRDTAGDSTMLRRKLAESAEEVAPLARRLQDFRESKGLTRAALALELGVTPITLYRWETGSTRPSPLAAERLSELGFGPLADHETNVSSIPRLKANVHTHNGVRTSSKFAARAQELKKSALMRLGDGDRSIAIVPSAFVRNGPPDQEPFHQNLLALQMTGDLTRDKNRYSRRLSMVEAVDEVGPTAQHLLERPKPTAVFWNSNYGTHGWHRYVGRFPPHVVRALLNRFGAHSQSVVCDPFVGSGTTAVECRLLGIPFVGIEICPLSCLMTRAKSTFPEDPSVLTNLAHSFAKFYAQQMSRFLRKRAISDITFEEILARPGNPVPAFANIQRWFTPEAMLGVSFAVQFGMSLHGFERDAVLLALSSKMRSIGNVDVDVVRAEYSKKPRANVDVGRLVSERLARMAMDVTRSMSSHSGLLGPSSSIKLFEGSVLDVDLPEASVDHVITSPPYGVEALSYLRTHLLSYRSLVGFLEHDPYETRDKTIGSEYLPNESAQAEHLAERVSRQCKSFFAKSHGVADSKYELRRAAMVQFFDDMLRVGQRLSKWLRDDGNVAFIVGNKRLGEDVIPTDVIVRELFDACGLSYVDALRHKLKTNNSNSQVPWQERIIQEESILIFRRNRRSR